MNPNQKDPYDILSSKIEDFLNDRTSTFRWKRQSERCSICLGKISLCFLPSDINLKTHIWAIRESYIGSDDCYDVYSFDEVSDTSELPGFNLSLFPTASIFGANPMFQKLQGKH